MATHNRIRDRIAELGGEFQHTETLVEIADKQLVHVKREHRRALALALCQGESNFRNVFGHDAVRNPIKSPPGGLLHVTKTNYGVYLRHRKAGEGMQGVGWTQLTYYTIQDRADRLGGCWIVKNQLLIGFGDLDALIKAYGARDGLAAYNAGPGNRHGSKGQAYATKILRLYAPWLNLTNRRGK